jgi:hypothetical protein
MYTLHAPIDAAQGRRFIDAVALPTPRTAWALALTGLLLSAGVAAQTKAATPPLTAAPPAREALVERIVTEDGGSRIEELRVRSQTRSIHVQTKGVLANGYEVVPADPARDTAPGPSSGGGSSGKRVWKVLSF